MRHPALRTTARAAVLLIAAGLGFGAASPVSGQGLTYTLTPAATWIEWDDQVGFDRTRLLGGEVGIGFGRYVGLSGYYQREKGVPTDLSGTGLELNGGAIPSQNVDLARMGGRISLALGTGSIVPVLSGGGGILQFRPEDGDESRQLTLDWGAGLRAVLGETLTGEVMIESSNYRLDRYSLAPGWTAGDAAFPTDPSAGDTWKNLTLSAGLGLQLGRRSLKSASDLDDAFAQRYQAPFRGFALAVEPLAGRLDFDGATGLENQEMVGVRAGFDFGSFFGLRGFYWQGTEGDYRSTVGMKAWGGEAQFALAAGPGLNPYLVTGAGQLEWDSDFDPDPARIPADQTALILGVGTDFNFGPRLRATVAARDFILAGSDLSRRTGLDNAASASDLVHNWQFSAGLKFVVGGGGGIRFNRPRPVQPVQPAAPAAGAAAAEPTAAPAGAAVAEPTEGVAGQEPAAVPVRRVAGAGAQAPSAAPAVDTARAVAAAGEIPTRMDTAAAAPAAVQPRTLVIPMPEKGEIYIRIGEPAGRGGMMPGAVAVAGAPVSDSTSDATGVARDVAAPAGGAPAALDVETLRRLIREELGAQRPAAQAADTARIRRLERELEARVRELEARERALAGAGAAPVSVTPAAPSRLPTERSVREYRPFAGVSDEGGLQLLSGVQLDIGPLNPGSRFNLMPQVQWGFGSGKPRWILSMGLEARLPVLVDRPGWTFQPLASLGPSLLKRDEFEVGLTTFVGAATRLRRADGTERAHLFYGYQGADLFSQGRFLIGLRRMR